MGDLDEFYVHTISVETKTGTGAYGDVYLAPVNVTGWLEPKKRLVRNKDGQEVVSASMFACPVEHEAKFTPDSRITYGAKTSYVIGASALTSGALALPDHLEVDLG